MKVEEMKVETNSEIYKKGFQFVDKEQFLKILIAQMKYQNPLQPLKPEEFLSQLSLLTQVEQLQNLYGSVEGLKDVVVNSGKLSFLLLLGKKVLVEDNVMTKDDEVLIDAPQDFDRVVVLLKDLVTGDQKEITIQKEEPLVYRHKKENPSSVSAYAIKGESVIPCRVELYRVVKGIDVDEKGFARIIFGDGRSMYVSNINRVRQ